MYDNWHFAGDTGISGDVVIFDIDGVLADAYERHEKFFTDDMEAEDWERFYEAASLDGVIGEGLALLQCLNSNLFVALLTSRPSLYTAITQEWLQEQNIPHDLLIMRPAGDRRISPEIKRSEIHRMRGYDVRPRLAVDDDKRNVEMYREEGIPCLYVESGYYKF